MERHRFENDVAHRISRGIEGAGMINKAISDYMYQGDMLLNEHQITEMLEDLNQSRHEKAFFDTTQRIRFAPQIRTQIEQTANDEFKLGGKLVGGLLQQILGEGDSSGQEDSNRFKRQAQTGRNFPRNQWDPSVPIAYYFDVNLSSFIIKLTKKNFSNFKIRKHVELFV